ncbi:tRNA-splicing endonuclease subunit Sen2 isoform X1 [Astyanax mexicanus]|uniref:tRNA-splicing endonuclease subunit Sen2 n=1 Tax=Astyanax mexicanus TaxID=7994 RepID=A0A8B9JLS0_ASTMX|nr:tRNA-splicing endonuclease subunit Sen2 isoform X1 [Astyanax mexicanus]
MEAVFQAPKRRPKVYESFESPLPVPFTSVQGTSSLQGALICKAEIINQHVIVREADHIQALYGKGYFGKGVLSKSRPEHSISERWEYIGNECLPVIPLSRYQKLVSWAHSALLAQGLDEEVISETMQKLTQPIELNLREEHGAEHDNEPINNKKHQEMAASQTQSCDNFSQDQSMENEIAAEGLNDDRMDSESSEAEKPRRQGDPMYDPLAELYPQEPEQVDPNALAKVKCKRHDDWIIHCGCRLDESQMTSVLVQSGKESGSCLAHGYVLVEEPDEEDNGDPNEDDISCVRMAKLVCRINPFNMVEHLQLSYEEAFFLVYALGCLSIYYDGEALSVLQLWRMFCSVQPNFETNYAAYHYFRSKGWVPKPGIKYGTDLMLYRKGPPFYHASYSVVVEKVDDSFQGATLRPFSWRSFAAISRITGNVSKELMLCYVIVPSDMNKEDLSSPEFLKRVKVQEVIVSRWISSRERMEQDEI